MTTTINPYLRLLYYYDIDSKGILLYEKRKRKENICANSTNNKYIELWFMTIKMYFFVIILLIKDIIICVC